MPELFGNAYILPVVIVVVLLLALLLILMIRRRQSAGSKDERPTERVTTPMSQTASAEARQKPAAAAVPSEEPVGAEPRTVTEAQATTEAQPVPPEQPPLPATAATRATAPPEQAQLIDDPLKAVIVDIVHGWGELTREDTNRLDLFRPDKVLAAAETIELPKDDAGGYARTRLLAIKKYATDKQTQGQAPEPAPPAASEPSTEIEATQAPQSEAAQPETPEVEVQDTRDETAGPLLETPRPNGHGAGASLAGAGLAVAGVALATGTDGEDEEQIEDRESLERALADGDSEWSAPEPVVISPWVQEPQQEESLAEEPVAISPWSEAPAGWDVQSPTVLEEVPVQPSAETPLESAEAVSAGEAAAAAQAAGTAESQGTTPGEDMTAGVEAPDDSLSGPHVRVRTAEELMALPSGERADMLAFMEPPELARVIEKSDDRALKKSVVDALENLGNTASLDALRRCLDDPDEEIQVYALDAAERLLGDE